MRELGVSARQRGRPHPGIWGIGVVAVGGARHLCANMPLYARIRIRTHRSAYFSGRVKREAVITFALTRGRDAPRPRPLEGLTYLRGCDPISPIQVLAPPKGSQIFSSGLVGRRRGACLHTKVGVRWGGASWDAIEPAIPSRE